MADLDPATLTERVLRLGRAAPLNQLTTAELTLLALAGREMVYTKRTLLVPARDRAPAMYVPLTGRLRAIRNGESVPGDPLRDFYGGTSLLSDSVISADVVAEPGTALFVLDRDVFFSLMEEHGALARSLLYHLSHRVIELRGAAIVTSGIRLGDASAAPSSDVLSRMLLLRDAMGLQSRSLPVLAQLSRGARVRHTAAGKGMWPVSSEPAHVAVTMQGAVDLVRNGVVAGRVEAGEAVGLAEAVSKSPASYSGMASGDVTTLEVSCAEVQEAIEDHDDFCQDLVRVMASELHRRVFGALVVAHA
jgi:CRP-like cAMP-binding protein